MRSPFHFAWRLLALSLAISLLASQGRVRATYDSARVTFHDATGLALSTLAETFVVNSTLDAVDAAPGNGVCATAGAVCTLRAAVQEANALAGPDIVTLPSGTYVLSIAGAGESQAATGDLDVNSALTINGTGADTTIIDANALDRVFEFNSAGSTFALNGLTIRNGNSGASPGGCITHSLSTGDLVLSQSVVTGCTSAVAGGGLRINGTATITGSVISGNSAPQGGGINSQGTIILANSTISGNTATTGAGGAIHTGITAGSAMSLVNVSIANNSSGISGAVRVFSPGTLQARNTIVANSLGAASVNCSGTITSLGNNLEFPGTVCGFTSANPLLGPLANNGGPTQTHALGTGSPAVDAGDAATCAAAPVSNVDQRGTTRPVGAQCDIGAFEGAVNLSPTLVVNSTLDAVDAAPGNGVCATAGAVCTLRAAIQEANALAGPDIITLPAGTYPLTIEGNTEGASATGDLDVNSDLTINGTGAATTTIDANSIDRALEFNAGTTSAVNNLTIRNGNASATQAGGCIRVNAGALALTGSVLTACTAPNGGGGMHFQPSTTGTINRTTISGNSSLQGGGINSQGILTIANTTISGNTATGSGGAIFTGITTGSGVTLINTTIASNSSASNGAVIVSSPSTLQARNTIVANSLGAASANCSGTITNLGNNLEFPGTVCGFTSADPLLGPLANNGGPSQTHALGTGSPAVEAGDAATCATAPVSGVDQRGTTRPVGAQCDIGAFEGSVNSTPIVVNSTLDAVDAAPGNGVCATGGGVCTLRAAVQEANALTGADTITLPVGIYTLTIAGTGENLAATGDLDATSSLTINGAGVATTIIDASALDRVFELSGGTFAVNDLTARNGNSVVSPTGGGCIRLGSGDLAVTRSALTGCSATAAGGGIWIEPPSTATISRSIISGNSSQQGGGINSQGTVTIANTTISGNTATTGTGGAIFTGITVGSAMTLVNVTITGNSSASSAATRVSAPGVLQLRNTIVANSAGAAPANCSGTISNLGNNLEFPGSTCGFSNTADPLLAALASNGGPTQTHALGTGSPAIDAGHNASCAASPVFGVDQRGISRPFGPTCDIGAFEFAAPTVLTLSATSVTATGVTLNGTVNPNGISTTALFDYGLTTSYGLQAAASPAPGSGGSPVAVSAAISGLTCNTPYHVRAAATNAAGTGIGTDISFSTAVCAGGFTDDPLIAEVTVVKAIHITELRSRVNALRLRFELAVVVWTDASLQPGAIMQRIHVSELRAGLIAAYNAATQTPPSFTDDPLTLQQTAIRKIHIDQLRAAVVALEAVP